MDEKLSIKDGLTLIYSHSECKLEICAKSWEEIGKNIDKKLSMIFFEVLSKNFADL